MDFKTVGIFFLILIVAFYLAPYISEFFTPQSKDCEAYYELLERDSYTLEYADRLKAASKKCF